MTALFYIGAAMLSLGIFGGFGALIKLMAEDSWVGASIVGLIGLPISAGASYAMFSAAAANDSPVLATLQKSEWACVASHRETTTTFAMVGKVVAPITSTRTVCDTYARAQ
jgi:vacuolar-type H+-ATPase subunit I/STV1